MRKAVLLLILLLLTAAVYALFLVIPELARKRVYSLVDQRTRFPGAGEITQRIEEKLLVFPHPTGKPFYVPVEQEEFYRSPDYQVFSIKGDENAFAYTVGFFVGWGAVEGSQDKLVMLSDPAQKNKNYAYRVGLSPSTLFGDNLTYLGVEDTLKVMRKIDNTVEEFRETPLANVPFWQIERVFKRGDAVVVVPLYDPPGLVKTDESGNILASWLILRRAGGKAALIKEMGKSFVVQR